MSQIREWLTNGLPADKNSIENGIIMSKCIMWPICIDPQNQATSFVKRHQKSNNLLCVSVNDSSLSKTIETAIRYTVMQDISIGAHQ